MTEPATTIQGSSLLPSPNLAGEGCPPPLAWSEVVAAVRAERDEFVLPTSWGDVQLSEFGSGPPLCVLGGATGDHDLFALFAWLLKEERRTLLVRLPDPPREVSREAWLPGWAQLVEETLKARNAGNVPIFATTTGGLVALQLALDIPTRVSHLILQGTVPTIRWSLSERILLAAARQMPGCLRQLPIWGRVVEANHRRWFPPFDETRWEFLRENLSATPIRQFARRMSAIPQAGWQSRLAGIHCPVLIVRTEGEGARVTAGQEGLAQVLPNSRTEWMHSTGQFPYLTHPHRLIKLIREFLGAAAPPAGPATHD